MDILGKARRLESKIAGRLDRAAKEFVRSGAREPIEIVHSILDAVEQEVQSSGRGTRVFPFNQIEVSVLAPSPEARAWLEAVFEGDPPLRARIVERLRSAGCPASEIVVATNYVARAQKNWTTREFRLGFARVTQPEVQEPDADSKHDRIEITVLRGVTEQRTYSFVASR